MAQDCFLTFGICRQMIMMQPGKLSILPLESKQWGSQASGNNWQVYYPLVFNNAVYGVWLIDYAAKTNNLQYAGISESESALNGFKMYTSAANDMGIAFLAIGR